jgi:hypothetical protein
MSKSVPFLRVKLISPALLMPIVKALERKRMLKTNADKLVKISVVGEAVSPVFSNVYKISAQGKPMVLPGVGGITYNIRVGDPACGWEADHVEPGISIENKESDTRYGRGANTALNVLACVGNEATIISGDAKGAKGVVTGKHGGIEHVLVDVQPDVMEKLMLGDKFQIKACGVGLKLLDFPDITAMNMDPRFLKALNPTPKGGKLEVPVTHIVPAAVMGSGLGSNETYSGDYDIQLFDEKTRKQNKLDSIRLGDLVAIMDADHAYGRIYRQGAVSVGIVVHTNCVIAGHGPGVTTLFTNSAGRIVPKIDPKANIAKIMRLRADI